MEFSDVRQGVLFIMQFLYLGYWLLGWLVWKGWLRFDNEGRFGRFANGAGQFFGRAWKDARWGMLAMLIIVGSAVVGVAAYGVALGVRAVMTGFGIS